MTLFAILLLASAVVVPHERLHGLAVGYYGSEPGYGIRLAHFVFPYAYATTDHRFARDQFLVVLLTPLVALTLVGVPLLVALEWPWPTVPVSANVGAVGDLWMALTLLGYPSHVDVEDHASGLRILGCEGDPRPEVSVTAAVRGALVGAVAASIALLVGLGIESLAVGRPGTVTYPFAFANTPEEPSLPLGPGVPILGALAGVAYALARTRRRDGRPAPRPAE